MAEVLYESSFAWSLGWKLVFPMFALVFAGFMSPRVNDPAGSVAAAVILLAMLPYSLLTAQVRFTTEGVAYRRLLRWKTHSWREFESVEAPKLYPFGVLVLKVKHSSFPFRQIWFSPERRANILGLNLENSLAYRIAERAITQFESDRLHGAAPKSLVVGKTVSAFHWIFLSGVTTLGVLFRVKSTYLAAKASRPTSLAAKVGDFLFDPSVLFFLFVCSALFYMVVRKAAGRWQRGAWRDIILCIASVPGLVILALVILRVIS